jgi:aspartate/tyrosine/aromatic aminotransferase
VNDSSLNKEYQGIPGDSTFVRLAQELILGKESKRLQQGFVAGAQTLSGTGGLRVLMEFIRYSFGSVRMLVSVPTWGNHNQIIDRSGLKQGTYRYWEPKSRGLDIKGMLEDLNNANKGDWVLLHACAHNPTGVDPSIKEWGLIADCVQKNGLNVFFDTAYQGFASGDLVKDAAAIRLFDSRGIEFVVTQSFAKNIGLYGERIGCVSVVTNCLKSKKACQTQLNGVIRPMYSNPPKHGMEIAKRVLSSKEYFNLWQEEMIEMSGRIIKMRQVLRESLEKLKTPGTWNHLTDQIGMFSYTGLTKEQVKVMVSKHHVYLLDNGRISMAGINTKNVDKLARAIDDVVRNVSSKL